jgi:hypothetical protein
MKLLALLSGIFLCNHTFSQQPPPNIFIITTDGFRWQEIFEGADSAIINNTAYVADTGLLKQLYWHTAANERRKLLLPFVWNVIEKNGSLYGNKNYNSSVSVANPYRFSYAGYNEILTGFADPSVIVNRKKLNTNENVLEFLNNQPAYKNKVAAFASWHLFNYILNKKNTGIYLNSGYSNLQHDALTETETMVEGIQEHVVNNTEHTRNDMLTFVTAKEYILNNHPKIVYIGFGETDEYAHQKNYSGYLESMHMVDEYIKQLWYLVSADTFYKNNTTFIITTDHGRGNKTQTWPKHNMFTKGSSNTWLLALGKNIAANGEAKNSPEIFAEQIAQTVATLAGFTFTSTHPVEEKINLIGLK